ncbi:UNVERIFIED_CONTAM: Protein fam49a [Siphonaria sp. JEL0065]|nr:Protein fam49a [Siphonaria sp. JEL0065]
MGATLCLPESDVKQQPPAHINVSFFSKGLLVSVDSQNSTNLIKKHPQDSHPKPEEVQLFMYGNTLLAQSNEHLSSLKNYRGCGDSIRMAIGRPSPQADEAVWHALVPAILQLKRYYDYSLQIVFDELKITNPNIQNEFSYYRRALQKARMSGNQKSSGTGPRMVVDDATANAMSMFYAQPSPMMKSLVDICLKTHKGLSRENILEIISLLAAACYNMVVNRGQMMEYCLRVLVQCIILYDHISTNEGGAFGKDSKVDIKSYVHAIQVNGGLLTASMISGIRYSTVHLNDENTPSGMRDFVNEL